MRCALFYHSFISDWNHGNAHFIRGIARELITLGNEVILYEPEDGWSRNNLIKNHGTGIIGEYYQFFPQLHSRLYRHETLDLDKALDGCDLVIVHEWNDAELVRKIGEHRKLNTGYKLLFHDTHHRSVTAPESIGSYDLRWYDGVLAFGKIIAELYLKQGWIQRAWVWHEAADTYIFTPRFAETHQGDIVWIGNWGDDERSREIQEYFIEPVKRLRLKSSVYGVRYPETALKLLEKSLIAYNGWIPNYRVPEIFSLYTFTIHIPRRPYAAMLPGIPTIRVFEALACAIPLISAPWDDAEGLFDPQKDYVLVRNGVQMKNAMRTMVHDREYASTIADHGMKTIQSRHTCKHRVDELYRIAQRIGVKIDTIPSQINGEYHTPR